MGARTVALLAATLFAGFLPIVAANAQRAAADSASRASADSSIYVAFLELVNRDPRRDTLYIEDQSLVFQSMSAHYDSVAPGLAAELTKVSSPPRPATTLHLPPPIQWITATSPDSVRRIAMAASTPHSPGRGQGPGGIWMFSPIAYSKDGRSALFYYRVICGSLCGEQTLVWARKDAAGKWEVWRSAMLIIY